VDGAPLVTRGLKQSVAADEKREIFLEFVTLCGSVKVTAIDAATGTEASIVGPASAPRSTLESAAVQKLRYVIGKAAKR
jgi:hypothetical protein